MTHYRSMGEVPAKRHSKFVRPGGGLYSEELMGEEGFSSSSSLLYHLHPPTGIVAAETIAEPPDCLVDNHPLLPRHLRTHDLASTPDLVGGRRLLLANGNVRMLYAEAQGPSSLYRNAAGDELIFIESGQADFESVFGALRAGPGDYVIVPASTTHRWTPLSDEPLRAFIVEAHGHIRPPRRYLSDEGQFLESAPYSERDIRGPGPPPAIDGAGETDVVVRQRAGLTRYTYSHHPFDVVGWD
jgi:homogentisate 1,2-dioxygenase